MEITRQREDPNAQGARFWSIIIYCLIAFGFFLRLYQFFHNRSLWLDEIYLSSSLIKMNFIELATLPLDYQQKAPIGYLWSSRLFVVLFGHGEMALRLFSLLCGLASVYIFLPVSRYFLKSKPAIAVAVGIMAMSPHLVYHAVEAKQYSTELLGTVLSLYLYIHYHKRTDYRSLFMWGLSGAIILWFSFSSIFVLAGTAGAISLVNLTSKDWKSFFIFLIPFLIWMFSFGLNFFVFTYKQSDSGWLVLWFQHRGGFMPVGFIDKIAWLFKQLISLFHFPLGLSWLTLPKGHDNLVIFITRMAFLPLAILALGIIYSFKKHFKTFLLLVIPFLLHLLATVLMLYPFFERLTVYLAPILILLLALGCEKFFSYISEWRRNRKVFSNIMFGVINKRLPSTNGTTDLVPPVSISQVIKHQKWSLLIALLLLLGPFIHSTRNFIFTETFGRFKHWHQREMYHYLNANFKDGDVVYIYWNALVPYRYYKQIYNFKFNAVEGKDYRFNSSTFEDYLGKLKADLDILRSHKRVWLVYGDFRDIQIGEIDDQPVWYYKNKDHLKAKRAEIKAIGKQVDVYKTRENIDLYLFESRK